jgi:O-succinylbenzoate synthase
MPLVHFETSFGRLYSRCILLLAVQCDGVVGGGECVAGEDPFYSSEWIELAWSTIEYHLSPAVLGRTLTAAETPARWLGTRAPHGVRPRRECTVGRGAIQKQQPLWKLRRHDARNSVWRLDVSVDSVEQLIEKDRTRLAAGYRRIKVKVVSGWDLNVLGGRSCAGRDCVEL